jgi:hypothetical protein
MVAKLAVEPGWGHFEIKGMARFFRDRPCTSFTGTGSSVTCTGYSNQSTEGWGLGAGAIVPVVKSKLDLIAEATIGNGMGRYGSGGGYDATINTMGDLVPLRTYHALVGPEIHPTPKLDVYLYGGYEYYQRTTYLATAQTPYFTSGTVVGYGSPLFNDSGCTKE